MKILLTTIALFCGISAVTSSFAVEQKVLFCADSISFTGSEVSCQDDCRQYSRSSCLQEELDAGWVIASAMPKAVPGGGSSYRTCKCVGSQYVLNKPDEKPSPPILNNEIALLNKEIELLKKENDMLKKESETLKKESETLKQEVDGRCQL